MDEKLKSENMQKQFSIFICHISEQSGQTGVEKENPLLNVVNIALSN